MPDQIKQPTHYNRHPSGIECKEITMCLSNGLANAVKYVWRCNDKHETPELDIGKAIEYLGYEVEELIQISRTRTSRDLCHSYQFQRVDGLLNVVISCEANHFIRKFYEHILAAIRGEANVVKFMGLQQAQEDLNSYLSDLSSATNPAHRAQVLR